MFLKKNVMVAEARINYAGLSEIQGLTQKQGAIYSNCFVRLFHRNSGVLVSEKKSDLRGEYVFKGLKASEVYFVVAFDRSKQYNAVIQDNVVPK